MLKIIPIEIVLLDYMGENMKLRWSQSVKLCVDDVYKKVVSYVNILTV